MGLQFSSSESRMNFGDLSTNFQIGDTRAEFTLFEKLQEPLRRLIAGRLGKVYQSKFSEDDIVQATFLSFFRRHKFEPFEIDNPDALWAIVSKIALRKCANEIQRYSRAKRDAKREVRASQGTLPDNANFFKVFSREPDPQRVAEGIDTVNRILKRLAPKQREVVVLRLKGFQNDDIAKQMEISERSVYRILNDVRFHIKRLKQVLTGTSR